MRRLDSWRRLRSVQTAGTVGLVVLGPALAAATFVVLGPLDQGAAAPALRLILLADLVYVLVVAALVAARVASLLAARRAHSAGSQLHLRLTGVFALLALIPTVLVAVFAVLTVNVGLEGWFSERVQRVVGSSLSAATAYEEEHRVELSRDASDLADFLNAERRATFFLAPGEIRQALGRVEALIERGLTEAYVIDGGGTIIARAPRSYEFDYERPTPEQIAQVNETGLLIIEDWDNNEFRALLPLNAFVDRYLLATREVDGEVLALLDETKETVVLYQQLESERGRLLFEFGLLYLGFSVILILAAIWAGLGFAERISRPVGRLASAAQRVGEGDLTAQVPNVRGNDEIATLGRMFNQMTTELQGQRDELLANTQQIERRRRLFDSVLSSVTSGVVGLDAEGKVTFANRSAHRLLEVDETPEHIALAVAVPEFADLFRRLTDSGQEAVQDQINLTRSRQQERLLVRMARRRREDGTLEGYVVAFDDVTELVSAQRMAAWGDVARRIAHEIKNPLTPIQLSAERIKRKFSPRLAEGAEALEEMTDVIVRQTGDLRRIVDEFSRFARMPEPQKTAQDLAAILRDAVTLQVAGQPDVAFSSDIPTEPLAADVDETMMSQAFTNLVKNAGEAIETRREGGFDGQGQIVIALTAEDDTATITISDNGIGLPADKARLFEPYVTTREKGTGLGLPIVRKIIEEHGGTLRLEDADADETGHSGARAVIRLPVLPEGRTPKTKTKKSQEQDGNP